MSTAETNRDPRLSRVLLVEDEADIRTIAKMALERFGALTVEVAASGEEALNRAAAFRPDMILLDVMMPGLDGPATLAKLRELPGLSQTPVVFMTAKVQPRDIEHLTSLGALGVIAKPFQALALVDRLLQFWAGMRAARAVQDSAVQDSALEELDILRQEYAASLRGRWEALAASWNEVKEGQPGALSAMRMNAHGLTGSGATLGFPQVSRVAAEIERLLGLRNEPAADPELDRAVESLLEELRRAMVPAEGEHESDWLRRAPVSSSTVPKPICIVEDEEDLARALQLQLRLFGFDVVTLASPALLEAELARRRPAAVVMDIMFEEGELAGPRAIVESALMRADAVPVIFMSGRTDLAARLAAVRAGASGYLAKPVRVAELVDRLDELTSVGEQEPPRVLLVGAPAFADRHAQALRAAGMSVAAAADPAEVPDLLGQEGIEVVVLQDPLPQCTGAEMARVVRQIDRTAMLPVLLLASDGANLASDAGEGLLYTRVREVDLVASAANAAQRFRAQRALLAQDGLTGLANHSRLMDQLDMEVARARRHGHVLAVAMIDVDHFKQLNDRLGHASGDHVLASLGRFLRQRLRKTDFVGRYGGEEFTVLMPETSGESALQRMDELRREFTAIRHFGASGSFGVTFSVGVASCPDAVSAAELAEWADQALYAAKRGGRDRVELALPRPMAPITAGEPSTSAGSGRRA